MKEEGFYGMVVKEALCNRSHQRCSTQAAGVNIKSDKAQHTMTIFYVP